MGAVYAVQIDTDHFTGNNAPIASLEGCYRNVNEKTPNHDDPSVSLTSAICAPLLIQLAEGSFPL